MNNPESCAAAQKASWKVSRKCLRKSSRTALFDVSCGFGGMETIVQNGCNNSSENDGKLSLKGTNINLKSFEMEPGAFQAGPWASVGSTRGFEELRRTRMSRSLAPHGRF